MKDFLNQEINIGDTVAFVGSNSGYFQIKTVIECSKRSRNQINMVKIQSEGYKAGWTFPSSLIVINELVK